MTRPAQISYVLFAVFIALLAWLHLGLFFLTVLFGYLALQALNFRRNKAVSVLLYLIAVSAIGAGLLYFASIAYRTFPRIAETSIPAMVEFAERNGIDLPFTDYSSLKSSALAQARDGIAIIGRYASIASLQTVLLIAGLAVALSIFLNPSWSAGNGDPPHKESLYSQVTSELTLRFRNLYQSFVRVMGAQIIISAINTGLTALYLVCARFPFSPLLVALAFLCGLVPIVGNLISNAVIVGVGFTISPKAGLIAFGFLVVIHKLEYFLDSKIIGRRINSPMWLTLIGLLIGERLMGLSGMVLAPVLLNFIRFEASERSSPHKDSPASDLVDV
ncbi:MAG TPA: AI-2E family transporter [Terracidiphilus sp.]|nr:AI-2E family transporter [Terracidiphilus sp.]